MKHTKGPWHIAFDQQSHGEHKVIEDSDQWIIARMPKPSPHHKKEDDANALLMTAAPEMLDQLKILTKAIDDDLDGIDIPNLALILIRAKGVIAKAEGRLPK